MILAGDIGGTKTAIALFDDSAGTLVRRAEQVFASAESHSLEQILLEFLSAQPARPVLSAACFGIAGAVVEGQVHTTNLPWSTLSEAGLARTLAVPRVKLLNDLQAMAYGMPLLGERELAVLNPGLPGARKGNVAVIAAGTGLGEAMLYWDGQRYHPIATEGGHADFAPRSPLEMELLGYLQGRFGAHISYERVLSGPGLYNLYCFLRDSSRAPQPPWLRERLAAAEDPSPVVSELGVAGSDPLCTQAVELFVSIYGAEAGNQALHNLAVGGIFIGGGIAPKILPALQKGAFMESLLSKGRLRNLLAGIRVSVALNPRTPVLGAAHYARTML